jgi:hypothetical protein
MFDSVLLRGLEKIRVFPFAFYFPSIRICNPKKSFQSDYKSLYSIPQDYKSCDRMKQEAIRKSLICRQFWIASLRSQFAMTDAEGLSTFLYIHINPDVTKFRHW